MKLTLSRALARANEWLLLGLVFLLPLFFLPWTLDVLEVNKQTLLVVVVAIAVLVWVGRILHEREVSLVRGWQNLLPLGFLVGWILASLFSIGGYVSWMGGASQEYQSVLSIAALTALFYLLTHTIRREALERRFFAALLFSGALVLFLALLNVLGASIFPWSFLQASAFNTIGSVNAFGVFAVLISVLGQALWLVGGGEQRDMFLSGWKGYAEKGLILFTTLATLFFLLAIDFWALWVLVLVGVGMLFLFGILRAGEFAHTNRFILPMAMGVIAIFFLFLSRPYALNLPIEVTPTLNASWSIVQDTWTDQSSLFGSGPGTYALDYSQYRSADINQTAFWNTRFDRGHSYFMTLLATGGVVSGVLFLVMILGLLFGSLRVLLAEKRHVIWKMHFVLLSTWVTLVASAFLYSWNFTLQFLFYALSAMVATQFLSGRTAKLRQSPRLSLSFSFVFVLFSIGVLTLFFVGVQRQMAEAQFAKAIRLDRSQVSIDEVIERLDRAATLNRYNDTYYRNLSQALLFKTNEVVGDTAQDGLTEESTQLLQLLTSSSINAAKRATDIAPYNVLNWRLRGDIYRELMPLVNGADQFAALSYERAMVLEPNNPLGPTGLARVYLASAGQAAQLAQAQDEAVREEARQTRNTLLASAEEALQKAIELKPDYAPAHFYLARVLEEQGRLEEAFAKLDAIRQYNPLDVGVAFQLGQLAMRMERYDRAQSEFEQAISLAPEFANARWFLASVYEILGNTDAAIEQVEILQKLIPENPVITARLNRLEEGKLKADLPDPLEEEGETEIE